MNDHRLAESVPEQNRTEMNFFNPGGGPYNAVSPVAFDVTRRGYDRDQVEKHLAGLAAELEGYRPRLAETQQRLAEAEQRLAETQQRLAEADRAGGHGFGERVETMLRVAEHEAAEVRAVAAEKAAATIEQARIQAESLEREATRAAAAQQVAAEQRTRQLEARIQAHLAAMDSEITAARMEAVAIVAKAEGLAASTVERAEVRARDTRAAADRAAAEQREKARSEIGRLAGTRDGVRSDLARLQGLLGEVLGISQRTPTQ
ncbi:MAG: hypothetical protein M3Z25_04570 [Actinomycetota bacterium]|nr:hypothetical protein [Actinomycetota bacterium]